MPVYPSGLDLSSSHLRFLATRLRERRRAIGSRWRRLSAGRQELLTLAHLRNGHPYAQLAAGFGIGTTTAYRYITEAVDLLEAWHPRSDKPSAKHRGERSSCSTALSCPSTGSLPTGRSTRASTRSTA